MKEEKEGKKKKREERERKKKGKLNILSFVYLITSVNPLHNAQVCYFNNVWLMFLVFQKNFSFQTTVGPPARRPSPSHFPLRFFTLSTPPRPVLRISHSGSLTRQAPPPGPSHFSLRFFNLSIPPGRSFPFPTPVL